MDRDNDRGCLMKAKKWIAGALLVAMLTGCATSRSNFYTNPAGVGDGQICRTLVGDAATTDPEFQHALRSELRLRGVSDSDCGAIVQNENVAIGVGAILGAVIVAAAAGSRSGDHDSYYGSETYVDIDIDIPPPVQEQADWDQYQNATGVLVWGCRGVQTRQLFDPARCDGKEMVDYRWPAKTF
jgi:hypothetical protein